MRAVKLTDALFHLYSLVIIRKNTTMNATTLRYFVGRTARTHNLASQTSFPTSSALLANYYSVTKRSLSAPTQASAPDIRLYQYHICPFCNITKSLLAYAKLDYDKVEVNPLTNLHIILKKR